MLNAANERELCYLVKIDAIYPLPGYDRVESAAIGGWRCIVPKGQFEPGSVGVYFEIDSRVPSDKEVFAFMEKRNYKVKTIKMCKSISQGLVMHPNDFGWKINGDVVIDADGGLHSVEGESRFLTKILGVTYASDEDNKRKANSIDKYKKMVNRHPNIFKKKWARWLMSRNWGKKLMFIFFGKAKDKKNAWPDGKFPGVARTDQERVENMTWILQDKTPFIVTQKCDGSSGTYILERKGKNKFEFYVCSRNVRMLSEKQECYYGDHNYYWEVAKIYDIENKMKNWLIENNAEWVCWQGEICAPKIQKNPHNLTKTHFYCFHWTDSINGRLNIVYANDIWLSMNMEVVPIVSTDYILPDNFDNLKNSADGYYLETVCEGSTNCKREGFVYYKTTDPTFSFKNVSKEYLLNH